MTTRFGILARLADLMTIASRGAAERRDRCATYKEASAVCSKSYRMGEAAAYNDAHRLVGAEMRRLKNLWQNGALTADSFEI